MSTNDNFMAEPFVSANDAAKFLSIDRRFLLSLARRGIAGAYPLSTGGPVRTALTLLPLWRRRGRSSFPVVHLAWW